MCIQYASQLTMRLCEINPSLTEDTVDQKCTFDLQYFQLRRGHRLKSICADSWAPSLDGDDPVSLAGAWESAY